MIFSCFKQLYQDDHNKMIQFFPLTIVIFCLMTTIYFTLNVVILHFVEISKLAFFMYTADSLLKLTKNIQVRSKHRQFLTHVFNIITIYR